jgi:hypothetical protein
MAAAVGVTPMILSGSSLWSPRASVLASGLVFSMFFVLLVVPILFVIVEKRSDRERGPSKLAPVIALVAAKNCFSGRKKRYGGSLVVSSSLATLFAINFG